MVICPPSGFSCFLLLFTFTPVFSVTSHGPGQGPVLGPLPWMLEIWISDTCPFKDNWRTSPWNRSVPSKTAFKYLCSSKPVAIEDQADTKMLEVSTKTSWASSASKWLMNWTSSPSSAANDCRQELLNRTPPSRPPPSQAATVCRPPKRRSTTSPWLRPSFFNSLTRWFTFDSHNSLWILWAHPTNPFQI